MLFICSEQHCLRYGTSWHVCGAIKTDMQAESNVPWREDGERCVWSRHTLHRFPLQTTTDACSPMHRSRDAGAGRGSLYSSRRHAESRVTRHRLLDSEGPRPSSQISISPHPRSLSIHCSTARALMPWWWLFCCTMSTTRCMRRKMKRMIFRSWVSICPSILP